MARTYMDIDDREEHPDPCPACGFADHEAYALYCERCGKEIQPQNFCSNSACIRNDGKEIECSKEARFCPDCGGATTFSLEGRFGDAGSFAPHRSASPQNGQ